MHHYSYLALGDSYTIGESVLLHKNFPYQFVQLLRQKGLPVFAPEIIARTGWTTGELLHAMKDHNFLPAYDIVTLCIGVNNQYLGMEIMEYKTQFEELLNRAIELAQNKKDQVVVVSIPDYGVTPFAAEMDREKITRETDQFNTVNKAISIQYKVKYIDITPGSRKAETDADLIAADGLHPSEKEYSNWARMLFELVIKQLK